MASGQRRCSGYQRMLLATSVVRTSSTGLEPGHRNVDRFYLQIPGRVDRRSRCRFSPRPFPDRRALVLWTWAYISLPTTWGIIPRSKVKTGTVSVIGITALLASVLYLKGHIMVPGLYTGLVCPSRRAWNMKPVPCCSSLDPGPMLWTNKSVYPSPLKSPMAPVDPGARGHTQGFHDCQEHLTHHGDTQQSHSTRTHKPHQHSHPHPHPQEVSH